MHCFAREPIMLLRWPCPQLKAFHSISIETAVQALLGIWSRAVREAILTNQETHLINNVIGKK